MVGGMQTAPPPLYHPLLPRGVFRIVAPPSGNVMRRMRAEAKKTLPAHPRNPPWWLATKRNPATTEVLRDEIGALARHEGVSLASMYRRLVNLGLYEYRRRVGEAVDAAE